MKIGKHLVSKRTLALACAAIVLFTFGGVMGVRAAKAAPDIQSQDLEADFQLQHLGVHLYENGKWVGQRSGDNGERGKLLGYMYANKSDEAGAFVAGKAYEERIAAKNGTDVKQYVRIIIRKYWQVKTAKGFEKDTDLDPSLIKLSYNDNEINTESWINNENDSEYNTESWIKSENESTTESETYYYKSQLDNGKFTPPVVNKLVVDGKIAEGKKKIVEKDVNGKTIITYVYEYDGKYIALEADVQAVQTHNANDAIKGIWGVQNVKASNGTLSVSN